MNQNMENLIIDIKKQKSKTDNFIYEKKYFKSKFLNELKCGNT